MTARKNPRTWKGAEASVSMGSNRASLTPNRPKLQASPLARLRLAALLWPHVKGFNHG
jgi:hypothetical protein